MNENALPLISRYRDKGIIIDTNLLLVFLVGNVNPRLVGTAAKTDAYSLSDYERIRDVLACFNRWITIPQILTETGNLLKRNSGYNTSIDLNRELALFVLSGPMEESWMPSGQIIAHPAFPELGYADAAILTVAAGKHLILTADKPLQNFAGSLGVDVLPFQWIQAH